MEILCSLSSKVGGSAAELATNDISGVVEEWNGFEPDVLPRRMNISSKQQYISITVYNLAEDSMEKNKTRLAPVLRLRGGKGGFGSLLRGAGKQKIVDNVDDCRDLSGRRIRQKSEAAKLEQWKSKSEERQLERVALQHIKHKERAALKEKEEQVNVDEIRAAQRDVLKSVLDSVQSAVKNGVATSSHGPHLQPSSKKAGQGVGRYSTSRKRKWTGSLQPLDSTSTEEEEEEDDDI